MEPPPLLEPLLARLAAWSREIDAPAPPQADALADALRAAQAGWLEPEVWVLIVAMCAWWFRVVPVAPRRLRKALHRALAPADEFPTHVQEPQRARSREKPPSTEVIEAYVDQQLRARCGEDIDDGLWLFMRQTLRRELETLVAEWAGPRLGGGREAVAPATRRVWPVGPVGGGFSGVY